MLSFTGMLIWQSHGADATELIVVATFSILMMVLSILSELEKRK